MRPCIHFKVGTIEEKEIDDFAKATEIIMRIVEEYMFCPGKVETAIIIIDVEFR